jgi:hypothetical protein
MYLDQYERDFVEIATECVCRRCVYMVQERSRLCEGFASFCDFSDYTVKSAVLAVRRYWSSNSDIGAGTIGCT